MRMLILQLPLRFCTMREEPSLLFGFFHRRRLLRGAFSFLDQERPRFDLVPYPCRNGRGTSPHNKR